MQKWQKTLSRLAKKESQTSIRNPANAVQSSPSRELEIQEARKIARLVRAAANHGLYGANCLEQSLVLWCLLKRNGLESEVRIGARKEEDQLQAHAWVECCGVALNEDRGVDERYSPFSGAAASGSLESR